MIVGTIIGGNPSSFWSSLGERILGWLIQNICGGFGTEKGLICNIDTPQDFYIFWGITGIIFIVSIILFAYHIKKKLRKSI